MLLVRDQKDPSQHRALESAPEVFGNVNEFLYLLHGFGAWLRLHVAMGIEAPR